ncbi:hypothetical protein ILUMI_18653 [Ignelater luminosus]|uniref:YqaJ viral recombinase domain-containing protein n=1 Tax=Ignelater luminosus TaxID=2038154 RepID=A0A8K0CLN8_IGNLU|nr:hypothetical protein ILUMI_18653 [Ignelater luminosus]
MAKTYSRPKKRGKASVAKRRRDKKENSLKVCSNNEYVSEDVHEEQLPDLEIEVEAYDNNSIKRLEGCRVVNVEYFVQGTKKLAMHDIKCTMGKMRFQTEMRCGITSTFQYHCDTCDKTININTHPDESRKNVTESFVWGTLSVARSKDVNLLREDLQNLPRRKDEVNLLEVLEPKLLEEVSKAIDNIVRKIGRLQRNVTTNFTERYMSVVSKFTGGKRVNFTSGGSYQRRCLGAALVKRRYQTNDVKDNKDYGPSAEQALPDLPEKEFLRTKKRKLEEIENCTNDIEKIQINTTGQHSNELWNEFRKDRLTASMFGTVCKRRQNTPCHSLIKQLLYSISSHTIKNLPAPLRYGRINEEKAIEAFTNITWLVVNPCGLFIYKEKPYLGASPDGLVGENALVEVKFVWN